MNRTTIFCAAFAATAAAAISFPAFAQEVTQANQVRYDDLDLSSSAGAKALKARVEHAAKRVCTLNGDKSLESVMQARNCTKVAIARAMPQIELALANSGTQLAANSHVTVATH